MKNIGKWIWIASEDPDTYAEFSAKVTVEKGKRVTLYAASEGHYAAYIDEKLVLFSQSGAYPNAALYDSRAVSRYLADGKEHTLRILAWHLGVGSSNYMPDAPGLWFELRAGRECVLASDARILARRCDLYENEYKKIITVQLGLSFKYDATAKQISPWEKASLAKKRPRPKKRAVSPLRLLPLRPAASMWITDTGTLLVDLGEERVGFLSLSLVSERDQPLLITYAEHLVDGHVQRIIGHRDFSVEYVAKKGRNRFMHPLRRLAGRYIEVEFSSPIKVSHLCLHEVSRVFKEREVRFADPLLQKIYDVSVNTLRLSVHEHYEDCPWREQSMYLLDSRNQMLCGYYAFENTEIQRHNLLFFAEGQWENGFFPLCFPYSKHLAIPSFSLCYPRMVRDYVEHTGDRSVLPIVRPAMEKMLSAFASYIDESGLIPTFPYPFWNFYEWSEGSDRGTEPSRLPTDPYEKKYDLILNGMYVLAEREYAALYGEKSRAEGLLPALKTAFLVEETGLYRMTSGSDMGSVLSNSIAILVGMGDEKTAEKMLASKDLVPVTLSMHTYFYDALLQTNVNYSDYIVEDIKKKYGRMLAEDATTFWETENGWHDFDDAGSLCHGWSAIPAYYLCRLVLGMDEKTL